MKKKRVTMKDVRKRMCKMNVTGFSSMAKFSAKERMAHLDEIQRIRDRREKAAEQK